MNFNWFRRWTVGRLRCAHHDKVAFRNADLIALGTQGHIFDQHYLAPLQILSRWHKPDLLQQSRRIWTRCLDLCHQIVCLEDGCSWKKGDQKQSKWPHRLLFHLLHLRLKHASAENCGQLNSQLSWHAEKFKWRSIFLIRGWTFVRNAHSQMQFAPYGLIDLPTHSKNFAIKTNWVPPLSLLICVHGKNWN